MPFLDKKIDNIQCVNISIDGNINVHPNGNNYFINLCLGSHMIKFCNILYRLIVSLQLIWSISTGLKLAKIRMYTMSVWQLELYLFSIAYRTFSWTGMFVGRAAVWSCCIVCSTWLTSILSHFLRVNLIFQTCLKAKICHSDFYI